MKTLFVFFLGLFVFDAAFAQKIDTVVYYLNNAGREVSNKADADMILKIMPPDRTVDKKLFIVKGYYPNGRMKLSGNSKTSALPLGLQGVFYTFYPNGQKSGMQTFDNGRSVGDVIEYYPNGKLYTVKTLAENGRFLFQQCSDSTGIVLAEKGKGTWIEFGDDFSVSGAVGKVEKGIPQGAWLQQLNDSVTVERTFKNGDLLSTDRIYKYKSDSTIYPMDDTSAAKSAEVKPALFKGGTDALYHFLGKNIRYPATAREQHLTGRVLVSFVVEKDGYLAHFKVLKSVGGGCDEEAIRVLTASAPWTPANVNGKVVRVVHSLSISFSLASG